MNRLFPVSVHAVLISLALAAASNAETPVAGSMPAPSRIRVYVGTYTTPKNGSKGIHFLEMNGQTGELGASSIAAETKSPSFLALHPDRRFLYCVGEVSTFRGKPSGAVSAFRIDPATGSLKLLNQQSSAGVGPCYVSIDRAGRRVFTANYSNGSVGVIEVMPDGRLGEVLAADQHQGSSADKTRQAGPHAHSVLPDPSGNFILSPDLGIDRVVVQRLDIEKGVFSQPAPEPIPVEPGSGPRHLAFHPNGRFLYVVNEMASKVAAFSYDPSTGGARPLQTLSTLPDDFHEKNTGADIHVHPSGRFLYTSNRGHNSIAMFSIDVASGRLTPIGHESTQGKTPRNFNLDPSGAWLIAANQDSDSIVVFRINPESGRLAPSGSHATIPSPVCILFATP